MRPLSNSEKVLVAITIVVVIILIFAIYKIHENNKGGNNGGNNGSRPPSPNNQLVIPEYGYNPIPASPNPFLVKYPMPTPEPLNMVTPVNGINPLTGDTSVTISTNAGSNSGVFVSTHIPTLANVSFYGITTTGQLVYLHNNSPTWQPQNGNNNTPYTTNNGTQTAYQIRPNYICAPAQAYAGQKTIINTQPTNDYTQDMSYVILAGYYTWYYSPETDSDTYIGPQVIPTVSGDRVVTTAGSVCSIDTDGKYIRVFYQPTTKPSSVYYYIFEDSMLGATDSSPSTYSITEVTMDSSCNIFVLLSNGTAYYMDVTYYPVNVQYGTLTAIGTNTDIISITVDKEYNILYGLSTTGKIYMCNAVTKMEWMLPAVDIPLYTSIYLQENTTTVDALANRNYLRSICATNGISSKTSDTNFISSIDVQSYTYGNDPGNFVLSSTVPTPQICNFAISTNDNIYIYNSSTNAWVKWFDDDEITCPKILNMAGKYYAFGLQPTQTTNPLSNNIYDALNGNGLNAVSANLLTRYNYDKVNAAGYFEVGGDGAFAKDCRWGQFYNLSLNWISQYMTTYGDDGNSSHPLYSSDVGFISTNPINFDITVSYKNSGFINYVFLDSSVMSEDNETPFYRLMGRASLFDGYDITEYSKTMNFSFKLPNPNNDPYPNIFQDFAIDTAMNLIYIQDNKVYVSKYIDAQYPPFYGGSNLTPQQLEYTQWYLPPSLTDLTGYKLTMDKQNGIAYLYYFGANSGMQYYYANSSTGNTFVQLTMDMAPSLNVALPAGSLDLICINPIYY